MNIIPKISTLLLAVCLNACGEPEQKFRVKTVDESGSPMSDVECKAWFKKTGKSSPYKDYSVSGRTNAEGKLELEGETIWAPTLVEANAPGCYQSIVSDIWMTGRSAGRWEPWPVEVDLVLKKIRNPHAMYVARFDNQRWKAFPGKELGPFGFDLMVADWVAPYGSGKVADWILEANRTNPDDQDIMPSGTVVLRFPNPGDGILMCGNNGGSKLVGPAVAPESGYQNSWEFKNRYEKADSGDHNGDGPSDESYVFRVRTKLDENGNVASALYGKLDGRIIGWLPQTIPSVLMTYYMNGKPNERNLEWDMKNNLFKNLPEEHWPQRP